MSGSGVVKNEFIQPFVSMDILDSDDRRSSQDDPDFKTAYLMQCIKINPMGMTKPGLSGWVIMMKFYIERRYSTRELPF